MKDEIVEKFINKKKHSKNNKYIICEKDVKGGSNLEEKKKEMILKERVSNLKD